MVVRSDEQLSGEELLSLVGSWRTEESRSGADLDHTPAVEQNDLAREPSCFAQIMRR
jgi:hypothetical protein